MSAASAGLARALGQHRPGHALARAFHVDPDIHAAELELVWRRSWLYAGLSATIREPGRFFRFQLGDDSLIVVRGGDGRVHALHNVCRHRGMPVCPEPAGRVERWVCPYHQWSYDLDGALRGCGGMEAELATGDYGLLTAAAHEVSGLVFVWVGEQPAPFGPADAELAAALAVQGLDRARVAHELTYRVAAGWKLLWENNRECWHCHVGHPQYVRANFDAAPDTPRTRALARDRAEQHRRALGTLAPDTDEHAEPGLYRFPTAGRWWSANRTPTAPGFVTESIDGAPVAPLMGDYPDHDVGTLRVRAVPNLWAHASSDHAVLTRLVPLGPQHTEISVQWVVDEGAVEGRDVELGRLLPFWQLTSEQDWALCEANQRGVRSPAYRPGPYSDAREYNVAAFVDWYLERMREPA